MFVSLLLLDSNCSFADQKDLTKMDKKCNYFLSTFNGRKIKIMIYYHEFILILFVNKLLFFSPPLFLFRCQSRGKVKITFKQTYIKIALIEHLTNIIICYLR